MSGALLAVVLLHRLVHCRRSRLVPEPPWSRSHDLLPGVVVMNRRDRIEHFHLLHRSLASCGYGCEIDAEIGVWIEEDETSGLVIVGSRRNFAALQKKGKWKSVSKVMYERGYHVSPQQCEDKFNDLNKRYKKLNDMLGRGTSCQVVENHALLDSIGYLNDKEKDDVRKIMSSKHLFYEEMCSYHNGNRLHLPHDLALQRSLKLALRNKDDHENHQVEDLDDDDGEGEEHDEYEEQHFSHGGCRGVHYGGGGGPLKKARHSQSHEDVDHLGQVNSLECNKLSLAQMPCPQGGEESDRATLMQKQWIESRTLQLEEQKLQIQVEMLEMEKQRFRWERFSKKRDHELERMSMENERMKLENDRMGLELKQRELGVEL